MFVFCSITNSHNTCYSLFWSKKVAKSVLEIDYTPNTCFNIRIDNKELFQKYENTPIKLEILNEIVKIEQT